MFLYVMKNLISFQSNKSLNQAYLYSLDQIFLNQHKKNPKQTRIIICIWKYFKPNLYTDHARECVARECAATNFEIKPLLK